MLSIIWELSQARALFWNNSKAHVQIVTWQAVNWLNAEEVNKTNWYQDSYILTICSGSKDEELGGTSITNCENMPKKFNRT